MPPRLTRLLAGLCNGVAIVADRVVAERTAIDPGNNEMNVQRWKSSKKSRQYRNVETMVRTRRWLEEVPLFEYSSVAKTWHFSLSTRVLSVVLLYSVTTTPYSALLLLLRVITLSVIAPVHPCPCRSPRA